MNIDITAVFDQIPEFSSHEEAREWFKERYQENFLLRTRDESEDRNVYYYHLVKDKEAYQQYMQSFASPEKHQITSTKPFESYSTIEISEDGGISFSI